MNIPFLPEDLLKVGNYQITYFDEDVLIVDNWYENYEYFYEILQHIPLPRWKWTNEGRNFKDYYDCRPIINLNFIDNSKVDETLQTIQQIIEHYFNHQKPITLRTGLLEFNYFKNIKRDVSNNLQFFPHIDQSYNALVYMDKVCSGGTSLYPGIENLDNYEHDNLLFDVSSLDKKIIRSKPNRMVIFRGDIYHGGYIENHNEYVDNWRINQVLLFD